jgi:RNA-splicing ligase RtcB
MLLCLHAWAGLQVCVMIHTGSRGLGHQVCTDALAACDRYAGCKRAQAATVGLYLAAASVCSYRCRT